MKKLVLIFFLIPLSMLAQSGKTPMKVTDLLKVKQVSGVSIHPDGQRILYSVNSIEPEASSKWEYRYNNQLWLYANGSSRQLTSAGGGQATWSPDGKQLAFVRAAEGRPQIFLLNLDGGEPIQLTQSKYGVGQPKWSPDGSKILFSVNIPLAELITDAVFNPGGKMPEWPYEKPGFANNANLQPNKAVPNPDGNTDEIRAYLALNEKDRKAKVITKLNLQEEATVSNEMSCSHLMIMDAKPGAKATALTTGFYSYNSATFVGNGSQIIVSTDIDPTEHPDRSLESEIYLLNADGSGMKKLLGKKDMSYNSPTPSPSGKWLAFQYGPTGFVSVPALAIMPLGGSEKDIITIPFDRNKGSFVWSADEQAIWFTAPSNGGTVLCKANLSNKKVEVLTDYNSGVSSFDVRGNLVAFSKIMVENPSELYTSDLSVKNHQRVSNFNQDWVSERILSMPENRTFKNEKGMTVEYWIMKPANYQAGKKYPAILEIHGGPSAMWGPGEASMWHEFQYYAAQGYVVVYSNPRGSGGYGLDFLRGNINDWGAGPTSDVLTALDKAVGEGYIDTARLAVTGGSYAGYLTAWIIGHDQRFKVACAQRGVYDLRTFFGEGNAWRLVPNYFGGYPWNAATKTILERESPINYVENIKTPFIIFHGENDLRTGVIQSEMLYKSLKVLGRTVEYVRHPGATHEITRSGNNRQRIDQMLRTMEFFNRFIQH
jgi:dipeptidyl aminopeptidase/acylaminoacyl peptidase